MRVRVKYSKQGLMKFIGHLDMMRYFQKACRRAGIEVAYTEGLSPHMSMSFALPLGVGMTSDSEYVDVDLVHPLPGDEIVERLNRSVPEGVWFTEARQIPEGKAHKGMTLVSRADYTLRRKKEGGWEEGWCEDFLKWLDQPEILVVKKGKKTEKEINIRPLIFEARVVPAPAASFTREERIGKTKDGGCGITASSPETDGPALRLGLSAGLDRNIRPELVMQAFAEQTGRCREPFLFEINRDEVYADRGSDQAHDFIPLIDLGNVITAGAK